MRVDPVDSPPIPGCPALSRGRALLRLALRRAAGCAAVSSLTGDDPWQGRRAGAHRQGRHRASGAMASVDGPPAWRVWASLIL